MRILLVGLLTLIAGVVPVLGEEAIPGGGDGGIVILPAAQLNTRTWVPGEETRQLSRVLNEIREGVTFRLPDEMQDVAAFVQTPGVTGAHLTLMVLDGMLSISGDTVGALQHGDIGAVVVRVVDAEGNLLILRLGLDHPGQMSIVVY